MAQIGLFDYGQKFQTEALPTARSTWLCYTDKFDDPKLPGESSERGLRSCLEYRPAGRQHDGHQFSGAELAASGWDSCVS
jgi:hypothetical protein